MGMGIFKSSSVLLGGAILVSGCVTAPPIQLPSWSQVPSEPAADYAPYEATGMATLSGQAFLLQRGGGVVKAAGRSVTLDPATATGIEWWQKAGTSYMFRELIHPSPQFQRARRMTVAEIGRAVQQECRDRSRMPSSA
eukprot:TRINITY_DN14719_c0_g1_i5.p2 TRINITY_DN14719_c0_g1~~TRINITY_DN14719_c0_g1_i5.p2  ORF type:complete len:138 (-),score=19.94 TRINITY_DN14719_c0_g1_i5:22-435(-)